jgi:hypothetical protein
MRSLKDLSVAQLKKAIVIKTRIERLESDLSGLLGEPSAGAAAANGNGRKRRRKMSAAAKAKISAAAKARWAAWKAKGK